MNVDVRQRWWCYFGVNNDKAKRGRRAIATHAAGVTDLNTNIKGTETNGGKNVEVGSVEILRISIRDLYAAGTQPFFFVIK